ncbi:hypothetical protein [Allohahella sp. A8]|uniref:hypothetical protein n=1 Tax=Allohahella sp. A8 TaxID=3141461 RepID=UPI000C0ABC01|nr:hypothetical protein [Hahellaceae bacterium]|tara:strand:- start:87336 stop:87932 length:597 start_codon:yes stop_codon:yes gene_type:complete
MKLTQITSALFLLLSLAASGIAQAKDKLEEAEIKRWISAMPAMQAWGAENRAKLEQHQDPSNVMPNSPEAMVKPIKEAGLYDEAEKLVSKHGFDSPEDFSETSLQILSAYASVKMKEEMGQDVDAMYQQMQDAKKELENSGMSDQQKQMMAQQFAMAEQAYDAIKAVPEADRKAIQPFMAEIDAATQAKAAPQAAPKK